MREVLARIASATADLDAPLLAVDRASLDANLSDLLRRAGGTPIRIASKSVRVRGIVNHALARPGVRGVMAYSLREALWLVDHGCDDVLLGYPTVDVGALRSVALDERACRAITMMIDSAAHLDPIGSAGPWSAPPRVCLDIDASLRIGPVHIGVRRSPLRTPGDAAALATEAIRRGVAVTGVMFYEAQIAGVPDANRAVLWMKRKSASELAYRRRAVVDAVEDVVGATLLVNSGGTGSIEVSASDPAVTEVTAGSGLFVPTLFDRYRSFTARPAMFYALPVVRTPTSTLATVLGGGYIASGPAGPTRVPTPVGRTVRGVTSVARMSLLRNEGAGEVQTPLNGTGASVGDRIWFRHAKAGEVCERFAEVHIVEADGSLTTMPTYRGEGQAFG